MTVTRMKHNGAIVVTDIIRGYIEQEVYYGYTEEEAVQKFRATYNLDDSRGKIN